MSKNQTESSYVKPHEVISPKTRWKLIDVLFDGGEGEWAAAIGVWDGKIAVALRWNGTAHNPVGTPSSRGYPSWFIAPDELYAGIIQHKEVKPEKVVKARALLGLE